MTNQKLAYTFEEAAEKSGYSIRTLKHQVAAGNLLARYANSKGVIRHEDLAEWLDALSAEPPGGHPAVHVPEPWEEAGPATETQTNPPTPLFRTPEEVAPELGMSKTTLRKYCRQSGIHTRLGKRIMLHEDDIGRLVEWIREHQDKADEWWTEPERDPFA